MEGEHNMDIRPMTEDEIPAVSTLERELFSDCWSEKLLLGGLQNPAQHYSCLYLDGELAGYGGIQAVLDESELLRIGILKKFRNQGAGAFLLGRLLGAASERGATSMFLEVRKGNAGAIRLYEKFGFQIEGVRKGYYKNPAEDGLIMRKEL